MKKRFPVYVATMLFVVLAVSLCLIQYMEKPSMAFSCEIQAGGYTEQVRSWQDNNGKYYVFLPSYSSMECTVIRTDRAVSIGGITLQDGMNCSTLQLGRSYKYEKYGHYGRKLVGTVVFLQATGIPTLYIDTASGNMNLVHGSKNNVETVDLRLYESDGVLSYKSSSVEMNGRGNTTWTEYEKKPYSLRLPEEADLLQMGSARKWVLLANAVDHTYVRNKLIYDFADKVGLSYAPDSRWVELYLNREYAGLYLLSERNEVHNERVAVPEDTGFLVSMEIETRLASTGDPYFLTDSKQALRVHHWMGDIETLRKKWQSVENAILSEDGVDPVTGLGWQELIDLDSWAKKYLIEEIFGNIDGCYSSQYFYSNGVDKKIYAGPVWDYDLSIGRLWQMNNPKSIFANRLIVKNGVYAPWFYYLCQKPDFIERMYHIYETEFYPLMIDLIENELPLYRQQIESAAILDGIRWELTEEYIKCEEIDINDYLLERLRFLNDLWLNKVPFCFVCVDSGTGVNYTYQAVEVGANLSELPIFVENRYENFRGWFYTDNNEPIDPEKPIYGDLAICGKWATPKWAKFVDILIPIAVLGVLFCIILFATIKSQKKGKR